MSEKRKMVRSTKGQLKILVDYMSTNPQLANGVFTGPMGQELMLREWENLLALLGNHGPNKTVEQWRHTWRDVRKKARHEGATMQKSQKETGNYIDVPNLSEQTEQILNIIGSQSAQGTGAQDESGIGFHDEIVTVFRQQNQLFQEQNQLLRELVTALTALAQARPDATH